MNKEEQDIIIDLLLRRYKRTKNEKLLDLAKKVNTINWSFECINFNNCCIESVPDFNGICIDGITYHYKCLDLSANYLKFSDNGLKVITPIKLSETRDGV